MKTNSNSVQPAVGAAMATAQEAAQAAGQVMRKNLDRPKKINQTLAHDIKLELDVRCQKTIEKILLSAFPQTSMLGEEGLAGNQNAPWRWVVDPIDGTVNFTYGLPHACVSIALQEWTKPAGALASSPTPPDSGFETVLGVVYDPFLQEMWTATRGGPAKLNGKKIHVSDRRKLSESIVSMGFSKYETTLNAMVPVFNQLIHRARKVRILGAAALSLAWVAGGRLDAYREYGLRLWDVAAGGLIIESAGGEFWRRLVEEPHRYEIVASNGHLRPQIQRLANKAKKQD